MHAQVPQCVAAMSRLVQLNLDFNNLAVLPAWLGGLAALESLEAAGNALSALPAEMADLTRLTRLYLSCNKLTEVGHGRAARCTRGCMLLGAPLRALHLCVWPCDSNVAWNLPVIVSWLSGARTHRQPMRLLIA